MIENNTILFARKGKDYSEGIYLDPKMANRHGFICGATGTGKTITLKVLAESFSSLGVPVFLADVKGDLSGFIQPATATEDMQQRMSKYHLDAASFPFQTYPTQFFNIYGDHDIPLRTTISEMGPQLLSSILHLNDTQTDVLSVVFKIADDQKLLLTDTKDLKAMLNYVGDNHAQFKGDYGNIPTQSTAAIIRAIVALESEGADTFFGEPAINVTDFFTTGANGYGQINVLDSSVLVNKPHLYSAFMLYLLSELYETLPEVGDMDKPRLVFFFDEAHLLFDNADEALVERIEQMIKLIRSKGVGVYFVTQSPRDIPDAILAQLGNKIQHALRAYTPKEKKAIKACAESFRENPAFDTEELLQNLGIGEAVVSTLDEEGVPSMAEHAFILPPQSLMGAADATVKQQTINASNLFVKYSTPTDPDSAYEFLTRMQLQQQQHAEALKAQQEAEKAAEKAQAAQQKAMAKAIKSVGNTATGTIGREIGNMLGGTFGSFGKKLGGNVGASLARNLFGTLFKK